MYVDLKIIGQIFRKDMSEFLDFLSDENGTVEMISLLFDVPA